MVKKLSTASIINDESSCENESIATSRCSQFAVYARAVATAFGMPPTAPTIIGTDNSANLTLSAGTATPGRAKHALRRWAAIRMRVASGACRVVKVDTDSMPVDFMTKHKGRKLIDASVAYLTNSRNRVESDAGDVEGANGIKVKPEVSLLEVSALEVPASFMTLRSNKRKYPTPSPSMGGHAAPPVVAVPDPPPGPPPDTTLADPKHFAHRLFSHGPSSSRGVTYQMNKEGLVPSDEEDGMDGMCGLTHADVRRMYGGPEYPGDSDGQQFDDDDARNSD